MMFTRSSAFVAIMLALVFLLAFSNLLAAWFVVPELGDGKLIALMMASPQHFPAAKYLLGMWLIRTLHDFTWAVPVFAQWLPVSFQGPLGFIKAGGAIVMFANALLLLRFARPLLAVQLALLTPVWQLFALGYVEYYPFVAGALVAYLAWIFSRPLQAHSPIALGISSALLPLLYIGFAPVSALVLVLYCYRSAVRDVARVFVAALLAFVAALYLVLAQEAPNFFALLLKDLNLGETNTLYPAYKGLAAGEHSVFFGVGYALSKRHLLDVAMMAFCGLGIAGMLAWPLTIVSSLARLRDLRRNDVLALALLGWALIYLLFMLPKLGPMQDLDLFYVSYLLVAFAVGHVVEQRYIVFKPMVLGVWLCSSLVSLFVLLHMAAGTNP